MRRNVLLIGSILVLMLITANSTAFNLPVKAALSAVNTDSVEKIIKKYIQACGGSALAEIQTETRKGTLLRGVSGKVPLEIIAKAPGMWRYHQTFAWGDQVCYGFDGNVAWIQDTKGIQPMSPQQRQDMQMLLDFQAPLKIQEFYPQMTVKEAEKIGKRDATTLIATSQEGYATELSFDNETGLLLRVGGMVFEDYRDVGLIKRPFRILLGKDEGEKHLQMKIEFTETQHDLDVDDFQFRQPGFALPVKEPPLYVRRNHVEVSIEAMDACVGEYQHPTLKNVTYTVTRQQNHLMIERTGWGQRLEIKSESENDYFMQFLNRDFHFIKDASARVTHLVIEGDQPIKAKKIK